MSSSGISSLGSNQGQVSSAQREQMQKTREAALSAAADALNESPDELKKEMASGKSLGDIAAEKGVSTDDLQSKIEAAVKEANPNASDDQAAKITQRMISGHHHHHQQAAASPTADQPADGSAPPPDSTISVKA
jgi:hypothetical protein